MDKLDEYFALRVQVVWLVDPERRQVLAYHSLMDARRFGDSDVLSGENVLPGFTVSVAALFA